MSTLGSSAPARRCAQSSAAAEGPMTSTCPPELYSMLGTGAGSGSAAAAISAAIFGVACLPSADQPAVSRMLTKRSSAFDCAAAASSPKSAASCVQATSNSASPPSASWKLPACLRHNSVCSAIAAPDFSAAASAAASSCIVLLQLQSLSVLFSIAIGFGFGLGRLCGRLRAFLGLRLRGKKRAARVVQRLQHLLRNALVLGVVVDVGIEAVHHVEARVVQQLLQRRALDAFLHVGAQEGAEVRFEGQAVDGRQVGRLGIRGHCRH